MPSRGARTLPRRLFDLGFDGADADGADTNPTALVTRSVLVLAASFALASWTRATAYRALGPWRYPTTMVTFLALASVGLYLALGRPATARVRDRRTEQVGRQAAVEVESERHRFLAELQDAFDMVDSEAAALTLVSRSLAIVHAGPGELLLADSSRAHLHRAAASVHGAPGCGVTGPSRCPAVRRGQSTHFPSSTALSSCPRLTDRGPGLSALCVPVTILGSPMGVVHVTDPEGTVHTSAERVRVESLAAQAGARIGALRAAAASRLAATTDPLTGLANRRSMTDDLRRLAAPGRRYAVAFVELDLTGILDDAGGHAEEDHALRRFARVLATTVRDGDTVCRYGGEEFVLVLPDCDAAEAALLVRRLHDALTAEPASGAGAAATTTVGLADSTQAEDPLDVVAHAAAAMRRARHERLDRDRDRDPVRRPTAAAESGGAAGAHAAEPLAGPVGAPAGDPVTGPVAETADDPAAPGAAPGPDRVVVRLRG